MRRAFLCQVSNKSGYAMVVVLTSLSVIAALFSLSANQVNRDLRLNAAVGELSEGYQQRLAKLELVAELSSDDAADAETVRTGLGVTLLTTHSLVDLNTAAPVILRSLLEGYRLSEAEIERALARHADWRRSGAQMRSIGEFHGVAGIDRAALPNLDRLATVRSGREAFILSDAPPELSDHLSETKLGLADSKVASVKTQNTLPLVSNLVVFDLAGARLGVVHFDASRDVGYITVFDPF